MLFFAFPEQQSMHVVNIHMCRQDTFTLITKLQTKEYSAHCLLLPKLDIIKST